LATGGDAELGVVDRRDPGTCGLGYLGELLLAVGVVTLGIGLLKA
jgi:hypothetical protein